MTTWNSSTIRRSQKPRKRNLVKSHNSRKPKNSWLKIVFFRVGVNLLLEIRINVAFFGVFFRWKKFLDFVIFWMRKFTKFWNVLEQKRIFYGRKRMFYENVLEAEESFRMFVFLHVEVFRIFFLFYNIPNCSVIVCRTFFFIRSKKKEKTKNCVFVNCQNKTQIVNHFQNTKMKNGEISS